MDPVLIERLITQHGLSGVIAFCFGYFVIKKLPDLITRHLDSLDKHFDSIKDMMTDFDRRDSERHNEIMQFIEFIKDQKKNGIE